MTDLKPCPFCGGEAKVTSKANFSRIFEVIHCDCGASITDENAERNHITAWNTRTDNWQPIETAPDAGSTSDTVWVWDRHSKCVRSVWPDGSFWRHEHSRGTCLYSHWQPKVTPDPPKETDK